MTGSSTQGIDLVATVTNPDGNVLRLLQDPVGDRAVRARERVRYR